MAGVFADITHWIQNYFTNMSDAELYSTFIIIGAAIIFIIAERIWPYTKGQKVLREGFFWITSRICSLPWTSDSGRCATGP